VTVMGFHHMIHAFDKYLSLDSSICNLSSLCVVIFAMSQVGDLINIASVMHEPLVADDSLRHLVFT
jgi:hypothetical protein